MSKTVAVLYIALGRYSVFWRDFFLSAEKYFLPDCKKTYFVFTDNDSIEFENLDNVRKVHQDSLGWPYATMMRFHIFLGQEEALKQFDYIFFFNGNMEFVDTVGNEILPTDENDGLVMGLHPGFWGKPNTEFSYDRNPKSTSYIPMGVGNCYVQGCLNGGTMAAYLKLCHYCRDALQADLDNSVIPLWHDESILNKYVLDKNPLLMPCNYLYPENWKLSRKFANKKIIQRDKANPVFGGVDWLRGKTDVKVQPPKNEMPLRIVNINGGIGNQMFQYAFARALGDDVKIDNMTCYETKSEFATPREYQLDVFNVVTNVAKKSEIDKLRRKSLLKRIFGLPKIMMWQNLIYVFMRIYSPHGAMHIMSDIFKVKCILNIFVRNC